MPTLLPAARQAGTSAGLNSLLRGARAASPALEAESAVDRRVDEEVRARLVSIRGWRGLNNPWMHEDEHDVDYSYINLVANPERYTGYKVGVEESMPCTSVSPSSATFLRQPLEQRWS